MVWGKMMNIVFLVVCGFPYGDASSIRALNICRALNEGACNVHVIADYSSKYSEKVDFCTYETILPQGEKSFFTRQGLGKKSIVRLKEYCKKNTVDAVLLNARYDRYDKVVNFCRKNGIKVFVENCEWYHHSSFKLGLFDPRFWKNQNMIKKGFKQANGFISISRLLDEQKAQLGVPSVRVPTIMDIDTWEYNICNTTKPFIDIVYAGNPGKSKELLFPIIMAISQNRELQQKVRFHIYGPNYETVLKNIGKNNESVLRSLKESVFIHGRAKQTDMPNIMRSADYTIFLRPDRRSSNAGFPTKFGESMAVGTPVITNNTGDISLYLINGYNGVLLPDTDVKTIEKALLEEISLSDTERKKTRQAARVTAEENFDYKKYVSEIISIIKT